MLPYYIKINSQLTLYNHYTTNMVLLTRYNNVLQNQAQASEQFLATTKLATEKAICLKIKKKLIRIKCTFKDF